MKVAQMRAMKPNKLPEKAVAMSKVAVQSVADIGTKAQEKIKQGATKMAEVPGQVKSKMRELEKQTVGAAKAGWREGREKAKEGHDILPQGASGRTRIGVVAYKGRLTVHRNTEQEELKEDYGHDLGLGLSHEPLGSDEEQEDRLRESEERLSYKPKKKRTVPDVEGRQEPTKPQFRSRGKLERTEETEGRRSSSQESEGDETVERVPIGEGLEREKQAKICRPGRREHEQEELENPMEKSFIKQPDEPEKQGQRGRGSQRTHVGRIAVVEVHQVQAPRENEEQEEQIKEVQEMQKRLQEQRLEKEEQKRTERAEQEKWRRAQEEQKEREEQQRKAREEQEKQRMEREEQEKQRKEKEEQEKQRIEREEQEKQRKERAEQEKQRRAEEQEKQRREREEQEKQRKERAEQEKQRKAREESQRREEQQRQEEAKAERLVQEREEQEKQKRAQESHRREEQQKLERQQHEKQRREQDELERCKLRGHEVEKTHEKFVSLKEDVPAQVQVNVGLMRPTEEPGKMAKGTTQATKSTK